MLAQGSAPLQVEALVRVQRNHGAGPFFQHAIGNGLAAVRGRVHNLPGGQTILVTLKFDYRTDADIALDEIISQIVISSEDRAGNQVSVVTIDPNSVHLNPNRVPLYYFATLYKPFDSGGRNGYQVRIQIFGNYE